MELDSFLLNMKIELDATKDQLTREYLQPYRHLYCCEFIMPVGVVPPNKLEFKHLKHFYVTESENLHDYRSVVIHGHKSDSYCSGPKMCHLFGFWPTSEMSPRFKKVFEARWKSVYAVYEWEIPK